jgi:hypothetical protein
MWSFLKKLRGDRAARRLFAKVHRALALNRRGEARTDGLPLVEVSMRLEVKWRARGLHPWDYDLPNEEAAAKFIEQGLFDTEAALERLFASNPEVGCIDFEVLERKPDSVSAIIAGVVQKKEFAERKSPAIGMRLRSVGVNYHIVDSHFAPLAREPQRTEDARDAAKSHRIDSSHSAPRQEFRESVTH